MIDNQNISPELLVKRIPFLKTFNNQSRDKQIHFTKQSIQKNVKLNNSEFESLTVYIDFIYGYNKIRDNNIHYFVVETKFFPRKSEYMDDLLFRTLNYGIQQIAKDLSLRKEFLSEEPNLSKEQLDEAINEVNRIFFKIEEFAENSNLFDMNPLNEYSQKFFIKEKFRQLINESDKYIPQNYSQEFRQTGSGKSIFGKPNKAKADPEKIRLTHFRIANAKKITAAFKDALKNGQKDIDGFIRFNVDWNGQQLIGKIPSSFTKKEDINGNPVNYEFYFDTPELGDGAFQIKFDKQANAVTNTIRSKADMPNRPDLTSAADAGYSKDFDGLIKYFFVKAGVEGKYQNEAKRYSVFPTPAIDAAIKAFANFGTEMIDFLEGGRGYTSDDMGKEISNKMMFDKKVEKIRKDIEDKIRKPISHTLQWKEFKSNLYKKFENPKSPFKMDIDMEVDDFIRKLTKKNPFEPIKKPEISLPSTELSDFEKAEKEKQERLAKFKAQLAKRRGL